jgi:hypothetical protein
MAKGHLVAESVAGVHAEEPREGVEVAFAAVVLEVAAVALHDHRNVVAVTHLREVQPEMSQGVH